jgi:hypothetical protein
MVPMRGDRDAEKARWSKQQQKPSIPDSQQYPVFCVRHMVRGADFSLEHRSDEEKAALIDKLRLLSQMTWAEIRSAPRHGLGPEKIDKKQITFTLPAIVTEEVSLLAIRFMGKAPMLGFRVGTTFHIIGLDPNFCAYDHGG